MSITRRQLLKSGAVLGAGLSIGIRPSGALAGMDTIRGFQPSLWLNVGADGTVTIWIGKAEMGQGIEASLAMLVAEELCCPWKAVRVEKAPMLSGYGNRWTAGSRSVLESWQPLRMAGAAAREMLVQAAAEIWGLPVESCAARDGMVVHEGSARRLEYGALSAAASRLPVPPVPALKSPEDFVLIGRPLPSLDTRAKVTGAMDYGIDVAVPGMLTAAILHAPVFGGRVRSVDDGHLPSQPIVHVVALPGAVAVAADGFWTASQALKQLAVEWDDGEGRRLDSAAISETLHSAIRAPGVVARSAGDARSALAAAAGATFTADYELPFEAHAAMEPMSCTAHVRDGVCDLWLSSQNLFAAEAVAAARVMSSLEYGVRRALRKYLGRAIDSIRIHQVAMGGAFGRRLQQDFVDEAVTISAALQAPVKLVWSREEDFRHDFYHPTSLHRLTAAVGDGGLPVAWHHRSVGPGIKPKGAAQQLPYAVEHVTVECRQVDVGVPVGDWRSVHNHYNGFAVESFVDELAAAAGRDPLEYRLALLEAAPRYRTVLELAARESGWGSPPAPGRARGVALDAGFGSYVAQVAEVSVEGDRILVHRVICAVDCGIVVNPSIATAQIEGGVAFALTAALKSSITVRGGEVEQSNFHDHPILRCDEMPEVRVVFVPSAEPPGGVGELGVAPVAPAVANAVFAAVGRRLRQLPLALG